MRKFIYGLLGLGLALGVATSASAAPADLTDSITATVQGTGTGNLTNGVLTIYDNVTAEHHTRTITYYQHDGYNKTENLVSSQRPIGVVLKAEFIENACLSSKTDASVNPVGGFNIGCGGQLFAKPITQPPLGGDLIGRFCRKAQSPDPSPADCTSDPIHVSEGAAAGLGQYLRVGNKDHGGMLEVDYYCNVAGVDHNVDVTLPQVMATDYNGTKLTTWALVTKIVLLPLDATHTVPSAVLVLS